MDHKIYFINSISGSSIINQFLFGLIHLFTYHNRKIIYKYLFLFKIENFIVPGKSILMSLPHLKLLRIKELKMIEYLHLCKTNYKNYIIENPKSVK